jgi:hypothetical protein
LKKTWTILKDSREKKPLIFPSTLCFLDDQLPPTRLKSTTVQVHVVEATMKTGDYALMGHETDVLIERKGSLREIAGNCLTKDGRRRFIAQVDRIKSECQKPYLMLEGTPQDMLKPCSNVPKPFLALDAFQRILIEREVPILLLPGNTVSARRALGEWVARLLINGTFSHALGHNQVQQPDDR